MNKWFFLNIGFKTIFEIALITTAFFTDSNKLIYAFLIGSIGGVIFIFRLTMAINFNSNIAKDKMHFVFRIIFACSTLLLCLSGIPGLNLLFIVICLLFTLIAGLFDLITSIKIVKKDFNLTSFYQMEIFIYIVIIVLMLIQKTVIIWLTPMVLVVFLIELIAFDLKYKILLNKVRIILQAVGLIGFLISAYFSAVIFILDTKVYYDFNVLLLLLAFLFIYILLVGYYPIYNAIKEKQQITTADM